MDIHKPLPYTYIIRLIPTGQVYYGLRSANKVPAEDDLWVKYFTSSKIVHSLIKQYGKDAFMVQVRRVFPDQKTAAAWEKKVLCRMQVLKKSNVWLNQSIGGTLFNGANRKGCKASAETKQKLSGAKKGRVAYIPTPEQRLASSIRQKGVPKNNKGWKHTAETKSKIGQGHRGKLVSDDTKYKLSKAARNRTGKVKHSEETKAKMRESAKRNHQLNPRKHTAETKLKIKMALAARKL
jgi:hypothetical protein